MTVPIHHSPQHPAKVDSDACRGDDEPHLNRRQVDAWILILQPRDSSAHLADSIANLGYRQVVSGSSGISLFVRGDRVHRERQSERIAVVLGCTTSRSPASRLLENCDEPSGRLRDPFALVGHFAGVVSGPGGTCVITDHVGSISVHVGRSRHDDRIQALGTHLPDVAAVTGREYIDPVSAREFVLRGAITFPHTIRRDVTRLPPAVVTKIDSETRVDHHYWTPSAPERDPTSMDDVAGRARSIMQENLRSALDGVERTLLFFSGGEDCRVLGGLVASDRTIGTTLRGAIFLDHSNREHRLARWSSKLLGIPLDIRLRTPSHYVDTIEAATLLTGGGIDLNHNHAMGLVDPGEADLFVDGWTADSYLKGWALEHALATGLSPLEDGDPRDDVDEAIIDRRARRLSVLEDLRGGEDAPSWTSLWPISDHLDYGNLGVNIRARPSISPYMFGNFIDAILPVRERRKFDRALFWPMFGRSMGLAGWIPRSGGQLPRLAPHRSRLVTRFVRRLFRLEDGLTKRIGRSRSQGPWQSPNLPDAALDMLASRLAPARIRYIEGLLASGQTIDNLGSVGRKHRMIQLAMIADG
jgi:hypothetical protein